VFSILYFGIIVLANSMLQSLQTDNHGAVSPHFLRLAIRDGLTKVLFKRRGSPKYSYSPRGLAGKQGWAWSTKALSGQVYIPLGIVLVYKMSHYTPTYPRGVTPSDRISRKHNFFWLRVFGKKPIPFH